MFRLLILVLLSILFVSTLGFYAPGLKVRFDFTCVGIGTTAFIALPQNTTSAAASGWVQKTRPDSPPGLESLELWCPETDYTVCLLFDDTCYVAGLQLAFDEELVSNAEYDWAVQEFTKWTTTMNDITKRFFTVQQYYVSNGYHYYYNITTSSECIDELMFPWFPLIDHDQLIGIGFNLFAQYTPKTGSTNWFEYSGETAIRYTVPYGPECLYEIARRVGQVTLHTYFIESPYSVVCLA